MKQKQPKWLEHARAHATDYLARFINNPGVERIVAQYDPSYIDIASPDKRLDRLAAIAAKYWDFRKGLERYQVTTSQPMDAEGSELGKIVRDESAYLGATDSSSATLTHYDILAVLGGANMSPYNRLRYALEQDVTYDKLVFLGCEREVLKPEQTKTASYAPGAQTEYDLGKGAIVTLLGKELVKSKSYEIINAKWRIAHYEKKDGTPVLCLSAPPHRKARRAHTSDTYQFLLRVEGDGIAPGTDILFVTSEIYRYAQYFDAVRDIILTTGANVETIGYAPAYGGQDFKPSQILQELKSDIDAATRLRDAVKEQQHGKGPTASRPTKLELMHVPF